MVVITYFSIYILVLLGNYFSFYICLLKASCFLFCMINFFCWRVFFSLCLFLLYFILYLFLASSDINRYLVCRNVKIYPHRVQSEVILIEKFPKGHNAYNCYEWHIWSWLCYKWHIYWRMVSSSYGLCLIKFTYFRFLFNLMNINFLTLVVMRVKLKLIILVFVLTCINILFLDLNYFHFEVF